ncbi:hypothetical protein CEXT_330701 [Caerostris extrusa]|uniref:Uncharacterized protein n=1 Tax=Caerostris extrusa TaxID=172846 RepID=A0AAV4SQM5_CAEEX|nr:hypothetical protein CEXT_330701 [Caerostris extrusa]
MPILLSIGLIEAINLQSTSQTTMNLLAQHKSSHVIKNSHPTSKSQASLNALSVENEDSSRGFQTEKMYLEIPRAALTF